MRKYWFITLFLILFPIITEAADQIGQTIYAESAQDYNGWDVSLSSDGQIVAVGAPNNDSVNGVDSGHVRIYQWNLDTNSWEQMGEDIDGEASSDYSGRAISLSSDGQIIAVGASHNDSVNGVDSGHVRIYQWNLDTNSWEQMGEDIDGEASSDYIGRDVSLSSNGQIVAVGGDKYAQLHQWDSSVGSWVQLGRNIYEFSNAISLSSDGQTVAVGNIKGEDRWGEKVGVVTIYRWDSASYSWLRVGQPISGNTRYALNGYRVSLSSDGQIVAMVANNNQKLTGYIRIFKWSSHLNDWNQLGQDIYSFAESISLSSDGQIISIGNTQTLNNEGVVVLYRWDSDNESWLRFEQVINGEPLDYTGYSNELSASGEIIAIGSPYHLTRFGGNGGYLKVLELDTQPPTIKLIGSEKVVHPVGATYYDQGAIASDNKDTSVEVTTNGSVDTNREGVYTLKYEATDKAGNHANNLMRYILVTVDTDSDGAPDNCDEACIELGMAADSDDDNDGVLDTADAYPLISIGDLTDTDSDGAPDTCDAACVELGMAADSDDDNDGLADIADAYPLIAIGELTDTDADGAPDNCDEACIELGMAADSDDDNDGVLDTADAYPLISIGDLTDTDSDGAPDTCDAACVELGMAADSDDDNDGISDQLEIANGLNPLDSADATLDADNDGVSNIDEANAGSNISADDQPPIFTSTVSDIEVISTGLATVVELVNPTASDVASDVVVTNDSNGEFPVGLTTVTYTATDLAGNTATLTQQVNVLPYLAISSGRSLGEGQTIEIDVTLNGTPATYPVTADIVIGGTASEDDFTLSTTSILITEGLTQTVSLSAIDDGFGDSGETISLSLTNPVNAGLKPDTDSEQVFTITEEQILPSVNVSVVQDDVIGRTVDKQSNVLFDIDIEDPNGLDSLLVEWSGITSLSQADSGPDLILDTSNMEVGIYVLRLSITDNAVAGNNIVNQLITIKVIDTLPELTSMDSDGDGVSDIEEGFGDSDNDGIADYLDNTPQINLQPIGETFAQAQDGVTLALGATALAGDDNSIVIAPSSLPEDTTYEVKEVFDFTLTGLAVGASYELVLPLTQVIPADAVYRKLTDDGWVDFVEDANNAIHSTSVSGNCPAINSDLWEAGLVEGGNCLKLTIQDGSANDTDGLENGTVEDPSGIAVEKAPATPTPNPTPNTPTNGSGSSGGTNTIQVLILLWLLVIGRRIYLRP